MKNDHQYRQQQREPPSSIELFISISLFIHSPCRSKCPVIHNRQNLTHTSERLPNTHSNLIDFIMTCETRKLLHIKTPPFNCLNKQAITCFSSRNSVTQLLLRLATFLYTDDKLLVSFLRKQTPIFPFYARETCASGGQKFYTDGVVLQESVKCLSLVFTCDQNFKIRANQSEHLCRTNYVIDINFDNDNVRFEKARDYKRILKSNELQNSTQTFQDA